MAELGMLFSVLSLISLLGPLCLCPSLCLLARAAGVHQPHSSDHRPRRRFCMGSNKVLRVALGGDAATEYRTNLAQLAERVRGSTGLFFTKLPRDQASYLAVAQLVFTELEYGGGRYDGSS